MGSYMTFQSHLSIKMMQKILLNRNTPGDILSKRWHFVVLMLKMISKLQFTCVSFLLVSCTDLLLVIIVILIVVVVVAVVIVLYDE